MGIGSFGGVMTLGGGMSSGGVDISVRFPGLPTTIAGSGAAHVLPVVKSASLSTVIEDGIVVHLQPVTFEPKPDESKLSVDFTSGLGSAAFGQGVFAALLLGKDGHSSIR